MQELIFGLVSFAIAILSFLYGASRLFKKKTPLYLQLLICAVGCFAVEQLSFVVNLWCHVTTSTSVGMLGIFGCNFFLLSANLGTLDRIVDDGKGSKKARTAAFAAPVIMAILSAVAFLAWKDRDLFCAATWLVMLLPALPASYFNLKHILLPVDPFAFLNATRACNFAALAFYLVTAAYVICTALASQTISGVFSVLMSLSVLLLALSAVKGEKKWGI